MKEFTKQLKEMGFKRKSQRVFWYDNNGLFYVVSFKIEKDKELPKVGFEVSHAGMFGDGAPAQRCSPVGGWVCPYGVHNQAHYDGGKRPEWAFLERMVKEYFSYFKTAADWSTAIRTLKERAWPKIEEVPIDDGAGGMPPAWFINDIPNELKTASDFRKEIHSLFERNFEKYGFSFLDEHKIYVRERGELFDCIYFWHDEVSTFFRVKAWIWSKRLEGGEIPAFSELVDYYVPGLIRTADFLRDENAFDALLEKAIAFTGQFTTVREYVDYLKNNGNWLAKPRWDEINALLG